MRDIKFRAWVKNEKKMFYPSVEESFEIDAFSGKIIGINAKSSASLTLSAAEIENLIPCEYIGLKDKNEKEIYEGDICKGSGFYDEEATQIGVIEFLSGGFRCKNINQKTIRGGEMYLRYDIEVIGNIYENPELLK